jgi:haloalkane dehalogenase
VTPTAPGRQFEGLPGYDEPRYLEQDGLRMHYLDEGSGPPVLPCTAGPWSYLYRKIIPELTGPPRRSRPTISASAARTSRS